LLIVTSWTEIGAPPGRYGEVVGLPEVAELPVVLGLVDVGAVVRVVVVRAAEVVGAPVAVVSGAEVADVVSGTDGVGCEGSACREPLELLVLPAGAGLTSTYRVNTARKSRDSSRVEVRSRPFSSVAGSR
jgi:hypothetical protein